ncbi:MAG: hypothetical protein M0005_05585 [Actinomycetota bacterium]|nr:hypothetical protein [Actinomycetota bacterium]
MLFDKQLGGLLGPGRRQGVDWVLGEVTLLRPEGTEDPGTAERLRAAVARLFRRSDRAWAGASLTPAGASVLACIVRQDPLRLPDSPLPKA